MYATRTYRKALAHRQARLISSRARPTHAPESPMRSVHVSTNSRLVTQSIVTHSRRTVWAKPCAANASKLTRREVSHGRLTRRAARLNNTFHIF